MGGKTCQLDEGKEGGRYGGDSSRKPERREDGKKSNDGLGGSGKKGNY